VEIINHQLEDGVDLLFGVTGVRLILERGPWVCYIAFRMFHTSQLTYHRMPLSLTEETDLHQVFAQSTGLDIVVIGLGDTSKEVHGVGEILDAERHVLATLEYNMSFPNPMNFLRRISKADKYMAAAEM
jgi:hypothetical protein